MAEWSNAAVLKTVELYPRLRGFESLFLRRPNHSRSNAAGFLFSEDRKGLARLRSSENKKPYVPSTYGVIWSAVSSQWDHERSE